MSVLMWDAPKKARTPAQQRDHYSFEDGPIGGYDPNMSDDDKLRWKAKITGQKRGTLQVEIRKSMGGTQVTIIVCLRGGYTYKTYGPMPPNSHWPRSAFTDDVHIHMATNGPLQMTFDDFAELHQAVAEAKAKLEQIEQETTA
jgi:hypothetical protein